MVKRQCPPEHGPAKRGGRCDPCADKHAERERERRRAKARQTIPDVTRKSVVNIVRVCHDVERACEMLGITSQQVWGLWRMDATFAKSLDDALMESRNPNHPHGTQHYGMVHGCGCPECRGPRREAGKRWYKRKRAGDV